MNVIDNYGEFESPEEKSMIEVVEDPVKVVLASYEMFKKKNEQNTNKDYWYFYQPALIESSYKEALNILEDKHELKANEKELEEILNEIKNKTKNIDSTGLFLSALLNSTNLNILIIDEFPELDIMCYKLKKGKTVILKPKNKSYDLGKFAEEGSTTINQGSINNQGLEATGGNHINQGTTEHQGYFSKGGNHINQGTTTYQGYAATGGNHINIKTVKESKGKLVIDLSQKQHPLKSQLEQKLAELDFLKTNKSLKLMELVNAYDWQKFDKEINEICREIKKVYGK